MSESKYEHHESMGMVKFARITGSNYCMHGTDVPHNSFIELTIKRGSVRRDLHQEWYHGDEKYITVQLSHSQFSEMISNMNCGDGVPCTVKNLMGKRMESPESVNKGKLYSQEFKNDLEDISSQLDSSINDVIKLLSKNGASKKQKEELLNKLKNAKMKIASNLPFVEQQFQECIVKAQDDAKRNIEGHLLNLALLSADRGLVTHQESHELISTVNTKALKS